MKGVYSQNVIVDSLAQASSKRADLELLIEDNMDGVNNTASARTHLNELAMG